MASRAEQKAAARAEREKLQRAHTQANQRQQRLLIVGGVLLLAIVIVGVAIAISSSKSGPSNGLKKGGGVTKTVATVETLLKGIPQSGAHLGNANAPVTLTFFGDLECPICREFDASTLPTLINNDVRAGKVQIYFRALETASGGNPDSNAFNNQQVAALAAGEQNHMWDYLELFYAQQGQEDTGYVTSSFLSTIAGQIPGLDVSKWKTALNDTTLANQVQADQQLAQTDGLNSTPSLIAEGPKGTGSAIVGAQPYATIEQSIKSVS